MRTVQKPFKLIVLLLLFLFSTSFSQTNRIPVAPGEKGDIDANEWIEIQDLVMVRDMVLGQTGTFTADQQSAADMNDDGQIDEADFEQLKDILIGKASLPTSDLPFIKSIEPAMPLRGELITISGEFFGDSHGTVLLNDAPVAADHIVSWSNTIIECRVPVDALPGPLRISADRQSNAVFLHVNVIDVTAVSQDRITLRDDGLEYLDGIIVIDFIDTMPLEAIDQYLADNNLTRRGLIWRPKLVQADILDARDPFELADMLSARDDIENAAPSVLAKAEIILSERFPERIRNTYNATTANFDNAQVNFWYHHFAMRTFAGHRLVDYAVDRWVNDYPPDVRVAIIDGGMGDGSTNDPAEFRFRVRSPTDVGFGALFGIATGVRPLIDIPDWIDHGTAVAGMAAGEGRVSLGTGAHVNVRPIRTAFSNGRFDPFLVAAALEIAAADEHVRVVNMSIGSYDRGRSAFVNSIGQSGNLAIYQNEVEYLTAQGKIVVIAAGNETVDAALSAPPSLAPDQPRTASSPTILTVAATEPSISGGNQYEEPADYSNYGRNISVSAPGSFTFRWSGGIIDNTYAASGKNGTSFSAPLVAGLAAEMFFLDDILVNAGQRPAPATATQIVNWIEHTADDLGSPGFDIQFGNGRINVWKALLAVMNGGLAASISSPAWIGFEIRHSLEAPTQDVSNALFHHLNGAELYVDNIPLRDGSNYETVEQDITLFKRVSPMLKNSGEPFIPLPFLQSQQSNVMTNFTASFNEFFGSDIKTLQVRKADDPITTEPIFELPMDLNSINNGALPFISYDDFIYTMQVPHVVELQALKHGGTRSITETKNNVATTYPVATVDDTIHVKLWYPGFSPSVSSTDISFYSPGAFALTEPQNVDATGGAGFTSVFETVVHERAQSGPVTVRTITNQYDHVIQMASLVDLVIPRVVGVNPEGKNEGDLVKVSVNIPHYTASRQGVRVRFPGIEQDVQPDRIETVNAPGTTHIIHAKIPAGNISDGPLSITIDVDDGNSVEFKGGLLELTDSTPYAGYFQLNRFILRDSRGPNDYTPPTGRNRAPLRFNLNKVGAETDQDAIYFITADAENVMVSNLAGITGTLQNDGNIRLYTDIDQDDTVGNLEILLDPDADGETIEGSYKSTATNTMYDLSMEIDATLSASLEDDVSDFNGLFAGRATLQSQQGDEDILEAFKEIAAARFYPFGVVHVDNLIALLIMDPNTRSGVTKSLASPNRISNKIPALQKLAEDEGQAVLSYFMGELAGGQATFIIDDNVIFFGEDPDPDNNFSITFQFRASETQLRGQIVYFFKITNYDENDEPIVRTASMTFAYTGARQQKDKNSINITGILPYPEKGFPTVTNNSVTLDVVNVAYNYVNEQNAAVVLKVFGNNNPDNVLFTQPLPIAEGEQPAGTKVFRNVVVPSVDESVTLISVIVGIQPQNSTNTIEESSVITYSR